MTSLLQGIGLAFVLAGGLAVLGITDMGVNLVSVTQIHTLPILNTLTPGWVYVFLGLICFLIGNSLKRRTVLIIP